ncbi:hypothetical protein [Pseudogemmobacter sonorensis]|uniref:hypothetical protein n=1 Tax=Pseudogemmobacter sonorensis TaxID=2989681 RepID=UPI0036AA66D5
MFGFLAAILFIGHSLADPNLPSLVEAGMQAAALRDGTPPAEVEVQGIEGAPLAWNWDNSAQVGGVDGRAALTSGRITDLVLTEAQPIADHVEGMDSAGLVARWATAARAANPETRVWLYESWPPLGSGGAGEWRARIAADLPQWRAAAGEAARIIPAGQAMAALSLALEAGEVPGLSSIDAFLDDAGRLGGKGHYFVAMVHVAALTGTSPEGLPARLFRIWPSRDAVIDDAQAAALQRIAWRAVSGFETTAGGASVAEGVGIGSGAASAGAPSAEDPPADTPSASSLIPGVPAEAGPEIQPETLADAAEPATIAPEATGSETPASERLPAEAPETATPETAAAEAAAETAPAPSPPETTAPTGFAPITNPDLGFGLAGVNDWSVQQPFLDVMKTARPWTGHLPGQWGGWGEADLRRAGALDQDGWPLRLPPELTGIATLVLTDLPADAGGVAGRYVLSHEGHGEIRLDGRAGVVSRAPGRIVFDYTPGPGAVLVTLLEIDEADPIRAIRILREDREALFAAGEIFNPDWLARIEGARLLRFMDWMATNDSTLSRAADRPRPGDYSWAREGVPVEIAVALANRLRAEPWLNIPHMAEDALVADMAAAVAEGLDPGLRAWVEYSNEVWNWQFAQAAWAEDLGLARWGAKHAWVQYYALRAGQVMSIWSKALPADRLVRVVATQTGWQGLEEDILAAPHVLAEGLPPPAQGFDAYAVTGYVSGHLGSHERHPALMEWLAQSRATAEKDAAERGLTGAEAEAHVAAHRFDLAIERAAAEILDGGVTGQPVDTLAQVTGEIFPYHAEVAARHGLRLVMYEGGTHVVGLGPAVEDEELTAFFAALNYAPQMGEIYSGLLRGWAAATDAPFNAFVDVAAPGKWGSWGTLRHLHDDNPRWRALTRGCPTC